jgi:Uma2 family endonuclease
MSTGTQITLDEFRERYAGEHGVEFWFGEVVRKGVTNWLHALLQGILAEAFTDAYRDRRSLPNQAPST